MGQLPAQRTPLEISWLSVCVCVCVCASVRARARVCVEKELLAPPPKKTKPQLPQGCYKMPHTDPGLHLRSDLGSDPSKGHTLP